MNCLNYNKENTIIENTSIIEIVTSISAKYPNHELHVWNIERAELSLKWGIAPHQITDVYNGCIVVKFFSSETAEKLEAAERYAALSENDKADVDRAQERINLQNEAEYERLWQKNKVWANKR